MFELFDTVSGNVLADFDTHAEAVRFASSAVPVDAVPGLVLLVASGDGSVSRLRTGLEITRDAFRAPDTTSPAFRVRRRWVRGVGVLTAAVSQFRLEVEMDPFIGAVAAPRTVDWRASDDESAGRGSSNWRANPDTLGSFGPA